MERMTEAEIRVMEVLWKGGELPAGQIARTLQAEVGWNRNTTYTLLGRCIDKEAVTRRDPGFLCRALISRESVQKEEAEALAQRLFDGSQELLFASMLGGRKLTREEAARLHALIDDAGDEMP